MALRSAGVNWAAWIESTEACLLAGLGSLGLMVPTMASLTRPLCLWVGGWMEMGWDMMGRIDRWREGRRRVEIRRLQRDVVQSSSKIASRQPSALARGTWSSRWSGGRPEVALLLAPGSLNRVACPGPGAGGFRPRATPGPRLGKSGSLVTSRRAACQAHCQQLLD